MMDLEKAGQPCLMMSSIKKPSVEAVEDEGKDRDKDKPRNQHLWICPDTYFMSCLSHFVAILVFCTLLRFILLGAI